MGAGDELAFTIATDAGKHVWVRWLEPSLRGTLQWAKDEPIKDTNPALFRAFGGGGLKANGVISNVVRKNGETTITVKVKFSVCDNYSWDSPWAAMADNDYRDCLYLQKNNFRTHFINQLDLPELTYKIELIRGGPRMFLTP